MNLSFCSILLRRRWRPWRWRWRLVKRWLYLNFDALYTWMHVISVSPWGTSVQHCGGISSVLWRHTVSCIRGYSVLREDNISSLQGYRQCIGGFSALKRLLSVLVGDLSVLRRDTISTFEGISSVHICSNWSSQRYHFKFASGRSLPTVLPRPPISLQSTWG